jgi:hypothetical protein
MSPQAEVVTMQKAASTSSADGFASQIREAIRQAAEAEGTALDYAIKAGHLLLRAKESIKAERRKWGGWLLANKIAQPTASLYMRIAKNEDFIRENEVSSIRAADAALRNRGSDDEDDDGAGDNTAGKTNNGVVNSGGAAGGSAPSKPQRPVTRTRTPDISVALKPLAPEAVFTALLARFADNRDHLVALADLLVDHLKKSKAAS